MLHFSNRTKLDLAWVEQLRKDFLVLVGNIPRIKSYADASKVREGFKVYSKRFEEAFFDRLLNHDLKYDSGRLFHLSESDAKTLDKKWRKIGWDFLSHIRYLPVSYPDQYNTESNVMARFYGEAKAWDAKARRLAQTFWKVFKDDLDYLEKRNVSLSVRLYEPEIIELEGFKVEIRGFSDSTDDNWGTDAIERLKVALREYRSKATKTLPLLLKKQLPIQVDFETTLDHAAVYRGNHISVNTSGLMGVKIDTIVHTLAHEMGHHIWRAWLSGQDRETWDKTIHGDKVDLDIAQALAKWPDGEWAFELPKSSMGKTDPILALQLSSVSHHPEYKSLEKKEDFQALLDRGIRHISVPGTPITGYANKNPEEAFCEAIGMLVGYGLMAVHPSIRALLRVFLGSEIKVASTVMRVAHNHMQKVAGYFEPGAEVLYGKYKNKRGLLKEIIVDDRGVPMVVIEPIPKGRKQDKVMGLFNIWHADPEKRKALGL